MRQLALFLVYFFLFISNSTATSSLFHSDTLDLKKWTKDDFTKEFGANDTSIALINLFFKKNNRGKGQTIIGGAFLIGGIIAISSQSESNDDQKGFEDLISPVATPIPAILGTIFTASGIVKLKNYTKQKLYFILFKYKSENKIPEKYIRKLKTKYFPSRSTITPRF